MEWNWNWNDFFGKIAGVIVTIILTIVLGLMGVNKWVAQLIAGKGGDAVEESAKKDDKESNNKISEADIIKIREEERAKTIREIFENKEEERLKFEKEEIEKEKNNLLEERRQANLRDQQRQREQREALDRMRQEEAERENERIRREEERQEKAERERKLERDRNKLFDLLVLDASYTYDDILGGISDADIYIYNNSDYYVDKVIVKTEYVRSNGNIYTTHTLNVNGIKAHSKIKHRLPNSAWGISLNYYKTYAYCSALNWEVK